MYFDALKIKNFGPFRALDMTFSSVGTNLITGSNGTGKTQLIGAIIFSLAGAEAVDFRPEGQIPSQVVLTIREDARSETITCRLAEKDPAIEEPTVLVDRQVSRSHPHSEDKELSQYLLESLTDLNIPRFLFNPELNETPLTQQELDILTRFEWRDRETHRMWSELRRSYESANFGTEVLSEGGKRILGLACEFVRRQNVARSVPLLIDDAFWAFDQVGLKLIGDLIENIGQRDQVVILTSSDAVSNVVQRSVRTRLKLQSPAPRFLAALSYNYYLQSQLSRLSQGRTVSSFVLGQPIGVEENLCHEFKEVKGSNPVRAIRDVVDQYAVAFLNMGGREVGRIYWGVRNEDSVVVGVKLGFEERDQIRRLVTEKLFQIQPPIAPTAYRVKIHPAYDHNGIVPDLYVVEVTVPSSSSRYLYSTGRGEVFVKTDAGKKKLSPIGIQKEVLRRTRNNKDTG